MTTGSRKFFLNLAVKDLNVSVAFFTKLGFTFDKRFTDESATCMIVNDGACVMLLVDEKFKGFTSKSLCDTTTNIEGIFALSAESRDEVDRITDIALAQGGTPAEEPQDHGFMYGRSFQDPDGHVWDLFWMDPGAFGG